MYISIDCPAEVATFIEKVPLSQQEALLQQALIMYPYLSSGKASLAEIANILHVSRGTLIDIFDDLHLPYIDTTHEDVFDDIAFYKNLIWVFSRSYFVYGLFLYINLQVSK